MRWSALVLLLLPAAAWGQAAPSSAPPPAVVRARDDTRAQQLFGELMSPYCPGLTIATCPSPGADSLRQDIRGRLDRGETSRAIRASYVADWGERVLGAPPLRRWGVALWLTPGVLLLLGAVGLIWWLRALRRSPAAGDPEAPRPSPDGALPADRAILERLDEELRAFDDRE